MTPLKRLVDETFAGNLSGKDALTMFSRDMLLALLRAAVNDAYEQAARSVEAQPCVFGLDRIDRRPGFAAVIRALKETP